MDKSGNKRKDAKKSMFIASFWLLVAICIILASKNPLAPIPLIWRGHFAEGELVEIIEEEVSDDHYGVGVIETCVYSFTVNGRNFKAWYDSGDLGATVRIKYLPENPSIARIEGEGWRHRVSTQGIRSLLSYIGIISIPLCIALVYARSGIRGLRD